MAAKKKGAATGTSKGKPLSGADQGRVRKLLFQEAAEEDLEGLGTAELNWITVLAFMFSSRVCYARIVSGMEGRPLRLLSGQM